MAVEKPTARVTNIPKISTAKDLLTFLESKLGTNTITAIEIITDHNNWKSRGYGRVQFQTLEAKFTARTLSSQNNLVFNGRNLILSETYEDIVIRPFESNHCVENTVLHVGFMVKGDCMSVLESWKFVKAFVMPERKRVDFWVQFGDGDDGVCYKLEIRFEDIVETVGCCLDGEDKMNALLFKVRYAPKIYRKVCVPNVISKSTSNRYLFVKEDIDFHWVRTTDFSARNSAGQASCFCLELEKESLASDIFTGFPYFKTAVQILILQDGEEFRSSSEVVPLVRYEPHVELKYEILFQLNSLVHTQKISLAAVDNDLIEILAKLEMDVAIFLLQKLHKLPSTCFEPVSFIKTQLHLFERSSKNLPPSAQTRLKDHNVMTCHRVLITPTKIYCLGPELEKANYVVKHYASHASDFIRVSFVDEDWSKLPPMTLSTSVEQGIFSKPIKTRIYDRILSILQKGILIGTKRFEFLAFSASQLRNSSVWMFATNETVKAEDIRNWMGCFNKIRSVSKCAARMGQLFSSSSQTLVVRAQDVEIIPDVEVTTNGIDYCFSDGIGKISLSFAKQIAQKCGLTYTPSAFQIRYGGYKGVIAVDRNSFRKLSLRKSMLKFESKNRMLNVTKWTESMPCYLNREIVSLLTTLGVQDRPLLYLQDEQLVVLGKMLTDKEAAIEVLQSLSGVDILIKMLQTGYEPNTEPYLLMMLQAYYENQLSELRNRCRIFVPKGRILIGCLDETGILNYGQVYVRVTMTKRELEHGDQSYFQRVDETTSILIGKVVVTKNPCLHPGDIRVLDAVYELALEEKGFVDCVVFPKTGERPHPNECSGGDLDGDQFFISWDTGLIPPRTTSPMDYTGRRPRLMDHDVTLEEIKKFFVDYMISDTLGTISTAHLVHADCEPDKALSSKCLQLATLHSMAVDFAKSGAPAEMPKVLKPREFPDFLQRDDKPKYISSSALGKLYRATFALNISGTSMFDQAETIAPPKYDQDLEASGFEIFIELALSHKDMYEEKMNTLMIYYEMKTEDEILTGNMRNKSMYLLRDNRRYGEMKDRIILSIKNLKREAKGWFESSCSPSEYQKVASAWYHVTYHPSYYKEGNTYLSFPWVVGDILLNIKAVKSRGRNVEQQ